MPSGYRVGVALFHCLAGHFMQMFRQIVRHAPYTVCVFGRVGDGLMSAHGVWMQEDQISIKTHWHKNPLLKIP